MTDWWEALGQARQIFYGTGILAFFVLIVQLTLSLIGLGAEELDMIDPDHDGDGGVFSIRGIAAFLMAFGSVGGLSLSSGFSLILAIFFGSAAGVVLAVLIALMIRFLLAMKDSGNLDYWNAVGEVGTVYSTVPAEKQGSGQVEVKIQGRFITATALSRFEEPLKPGDRVRIVEIVSDTTLVVEPVGLI